MQHIFRPWFRLATLITVFLSAVLMTSQISAQPSITGTRLTIPILQVPGLGTVSIDMNLIDEVLQTYQVDPNSIVIVPDSENSNPPAFDGATLIIPELQIGSDIFTLNLILLDPVNFIFQLIPDSVVSLAPPGLDLAQPSISATGLVIPFFQFGADYFSVTMELIDISNLIFRVDLVTDLANVSQPQNPTSPLPILDDNTFVFEIPEVRVGVKTYSLSLSLLASDATSATFQLNLGSIADLTNF